MGIDSQFKDAVERATSPTLLEPDWAAILQVCDSIRQNDVSGKVAVSEIRKKIYDSNPHVAKNALITLEACVKNCGPVIHDEIACRAMMDDFRQLVTKCPETVKTEVLRLLNAWAYGFRNEPKYKIVEETRNLMKMEGYTFPERNESDAMFSALKAPDWADGDTCHRCRVKFSTFTRQHHCRCCGQVFCNKCSSKNSVIAKFGIEREVRVCDPCYDQLNPGEARSSSGGSSSSLSKSSDSNLPPEYLSSALAKESQVPEKKSDEDIKRQEQEDLQLAMALSVSEQETKQKPASQSSRIYDVIETRPSAPAKPSIYSYTSAPMQEEEPDDSELGRYLNRSYWEKRSENAAPPAYTDPSHEEDEPLPVTTTANSGENTGQTAQDAECETFISTFRTNVEKLMERMQYLAGKGRHISSDSITQSLFQTVSSMQPQLMTFIEQQEQEKEKYENMEEKLGVLTDTRRSLDEARAQRREKLRQQELEQDMLRRMQMEQKMELLRQQKEEYLLYQKQLETQRQQTLAKEQAMNMPSYGVYQPGVPVPGMPPQSAYVPGGQPVPPNYQSVTPGVQPYPSGVQRQGQPPYQPGNQYEPPTSQFQTMSLQGGGLPAPKQAQHAGMQPPPGQTYQPAPSQPRPQGITTQGETTPYPQPAGHPQNPQFGQPTQTNQPNQYQQVVSDGPRQSYPMEPNYPSSGPMSSYQGQHPPAPNMFTHTPPSSGPPSMEQYLSGPNSLQDNLTGGVPPQQPPPQFQPSTITTPQQFPPGQGPTPPQQFPPQQVPPAQQQQVPPAQQQQVPPPQQGQPSQFPPQQYPSPQPSSQQHPPQGRLQQQNIPTQGPPPQNAQPPQYGQGPPSQPPPSGQSSLQYQNQPIDSYQQAPGQQQWGQAPGGNYQQPPPPSYGGYEQQQYGQQQYYEQNVAEAQLISFD